MGLQILGSGEHRFASRLCDREMHRMRLRLLIPRFGLVHTVYVRVGSYLSISSKRANISLGASDPESYVRFKGAGRANDHRCVCLVVRLSPRCVWIIEHDP